MVKQNCPHRIATWILRLFSLFFLITRPASAMDDPETGNCLQAIQAGQLEMVKKFCSTSMKLVSGGGQKASLLYVATYNGHPEIVTYLLDRGELVNERSSYSHTIRRTKPRRRSWSSTADFKVKKQGSTFSAQAEVVKPLGILRSFFFPDKAENSKAEKIPQLMNDTVPWAPGEPILGTRTIRGETPLFAITRKSVISENDYLIAAALFRFGAQLDIEAEILNQLDPKETPLQRLEQRLQDMATTISPLAATTVGNIDSARRKFNRAFDNSKLKKLDIAHIWHVFADGFTTAKLVESAQFETLDKKKEVLLPFLNALANWELDSDLPNAYDAWQRYLGMKDLLAEKTCFNMLLKYFILHEKEEQRTSTPKSTMTLGEVRAQSPEEVAKALFAVHRDLFLRIDPRDIATKYNRGQTSKNLGRFLFRMQQLPFLVAYLIARSDKPRDEFIYWKKVLTRSFAMNDLFGSWCLYTGLNANAVSLVLDSTDLGKFPNFQDNKAYFQARNSVVGPLIPGIIHEGKQFSSFREGQDTSDTDIFTMDESGIFHAVTKFTEVFIQQQEKLRKDTGEPALNNLANFFYTLPERESTEDVAMLTAIFASKKNRNSVALEDTDKPAEYWDVHQFGAWLKQMAFDQEDVRVLIKHGIANGPTFLEAYAVTHASPEAKELKELRRFFTMYDGWCVPRGITALSNLDRKNQFPVNLWANSRSSFHWIMWLRNNGLSLTIAPLFSHSINNFWAFIETHEKTEEDKMLQMGLSPSQLKQMVDAAKTFKNCQGRPEEVAKWRLRHIESWLFQMGLAHHIPNIKQHGSWHSHKFLSIMYMAKKFASRAHKVIGNRRLVWAIPIAEAFPAALIREVEQDALDNPIFFAHLPKDNMHFVKVMLVIRASPETLLAFYNKHIRNFYELYYSWMSPEAFNQVEPSDSKSEDTPKDSGSRLPSSRSSSLIKEFMDNFPNTGFNERAKSDLEGYGLTEVQITQLEGIIGGGSPANGCDKSETVVPSEQVGLQTEMNEDAE